MCGSRLHWRERVLRISAGRNEILVRISGSFEGNRKKREKKEKKEKKKKRKKEKKKENSREIVVRISAGRGEIVVRISASSKEIVVRISAGRSEIVVRISASFQENSCADLRKFSPENFRTVKILMILKSFLVKFRFGAVQCSDIRADLEKE